MCEFSRKSEKNHDLVISGLIGGILVHSHQVISENLSKGKFTGSICHENINCLLCQGLLIYHVRANTYLRFPSYGQRYVKLANLGHSNRGTIYFQMSEFSETWCPTSPRHGLVGHQVSKGSII